MTTRDPVLEDLSNHLSEYDDKQAMQEWLYELDLLDDDGNLKEGAVIPEVER